MSSAPPALASKTAAFVARRALPSFLALLVGGCGAGREAVLDERVDGVAEGCRLLAASDLVPSGMSPVGVLGDVVRERGETRVHKLTFFYTDGAGLDSNCTLDNQRRSLVCADPCDSVPRPPILSLLDVEALRPDLADALALADATVGPAIASHTGPDLLIDMHLNSHGDRLVWDASYDVWLESGPAAVRLVPLDAATGAIVQNEAQGAPPAEPEPSD